MLSTRPILLIAIAVLVVGATTATMVVANRSAERPCVADPSLPQCGSGTTDCNPERPACQEKAQNERLRRYCAEYPRDAKCQA